MMKQFFLSVWQILTLLFIAGVLLLPARSDAGTFYNCIDGDGNETLSSYPIDGQTCRQVGKYEEKKSAQEGNETLRHVGSTIVSAGNKTTKIIVKGNSVLVPVTLVYGSNEAAVHLLLDTGASGTTINTEIADKLFIDLSKSQKIKAGVVGGAVIDASLIKIDSLAVGPYTIRNWPIFIVPHEGLTAKYDGLLGMDVLRELNYKVDFKKQVIIWD